MHQVCGLQMFADCLYVALMVLAKSFLDTFAQGSLSEYRVCAELLRWFT